METNLLLWLSAKRCTSNIAVERDAPQAGFARMLRAPHLERLTQRDENTNLRHVRDVRSGEGMFEGSRPSQVHLP